MNLGRTPPVLTAVFDLNVKHISLCQEHSCAVFSHVCVLSDGPSSCVKGPVAGGLLDSDGW